MQTNNQTITTKQNPMQNGNVNTGNVCILYQCVTKAEVKHQHHNKHHTGFNLKIWGLTPPSSN